MKPDVTALSWEILIRCAEATPACFFLFFFPRFSVHEFRFSYPAGVTLFTLFAPTNDAFAALGIGVATSLLMPANKAPLPGAVSRSHGLSQDAGSVFFDVVLFGALGLHLARGSLRQTVAGSTAGRVLFGARTVTCQDKLYQLLRYHLLPGWQNVSLAR